VFSRSATASWRFRLIEGFRICSLTTERVSVDGAPARMIGPRFTTRHSWAIAQRAMPRAAPTIINLLVALGGWGDRYHQDATSALQLQRRDVSPPSSPLRSSIHHAEIQT
jgi:hypothetical protein